MKKRRILGSERGFTLVELGIVMAIIAILAAVAYPTYTGMRKRAYIAEAKARMQEIRVTAWAHRLEDGDEFPAWSTLAPSAGGVDFDTEYWAFSLVSTDLTGNYVVKATGKKAPVKNDWFTLTVTTTGQASFSDLTEVAD